MIDQHSLISELHSADDIDVNQRAALIELANRIVSCYPEARFRTWRGIDDPDVVYLIAETELDDPDLVIDLVIDRVVDFLVEDDIHVGVMSGVTPERNAAIRAEQLRQQHERTLAAQVRA